MKRARWRRHRITSRTSHPGSDDHVGYRYEYCELPDSLVDKARWKPVVAGAWRVPGVIYEREARTSVHALRRFAASAKNHGCSFLCIGDNMADVLSSEKGRAKDHCLNRLCRQAAAIAFLSIFFACNKQNLLIIAKKLLIIAKSCLLKPDVSYTINFVCVFAR